MNNIRLIWIVISVTGAAGCQFVTLTDAGANVAQAGAGDVAQCTEVGQIETQTRSKVLVERGNEKVAGELAILARNRAAQLGANAIVPMTEPRYGQQAFKAYRCG